MGLRVAGRLTAMTVARLKRPGWHADGAGLYLQVSPSGVKSWVFRYERGARERAMGLGPLHTIGLAEAREAARECRRQLLQHIDPIDARNANKLAAVAAASKETTFTDAAARYIEVKEAGWRNAKHAQQWVNTLRDYAEPTLGRMRVRDIDTPHVLEVLRPIWHTKTETARRVRMRVERVLDWATTSGYRSGDNPARWKGHLENLLPAPGKIARVAHHSALPYRDVPAFMTALRAQPGLAARALEFAVATACRTNEVLGAEWSEFDLKAGVWTIPGERMKAGVEHVVPLAPSVLKLLKALPRVASERHVFPGAKPGRPLSNMAMLAVLKRMGRADITVHGFRSAFRIWAGERTNYPREVAEHALAHRLPDRVEAAYQRGTLFEKRRQMMRDWAALLRATSS